MNKAPASLIDAFQEVIQGETQSDDINPIIDQYVLRPGAPYLSGAHTMNAATGPFGVPYWMQGLAVQTCNNAYYTAPAPWQANIIIGAANTINSAGQYGIGAAPTAGIFTGVEDHC